MHRAMTGLWGVLVVILVLLTPGQTRTLELEDQTEENDIDVEFDAFFNDTLPEEEEEEEDEPYRPWRQNITIDDNTVLPGFKGRITQKGMDYARDVALSVMMRELAALEIPDIAQEIAGMDVEMTNIRISHFPEPESELETIPGIGLRWVTSGLEPIIEADYQAVIGLGFFRIVKNGSVRMTARDISFNLEFWIGRTYEGKPDIYVYDCVADGVIFLNFEGGWSDTLNFGAALAQDNIRDLILAQICANARQEIEVNAARAMEDFSVTHTFEDIFELDFRLVKFPEFYEDALETFHQGEISLITNDTSDEPPFPPPEIPEFPEHTDKMVYVYVSDYLINSGFYAAYSAGKLSLNVTSDSIPEEARSYLATSCTLSLCLGTLFPQLSEEFPNGEAALQIYPTRIPRVFFRDGQVMVRAAANLEVFIETDLLTAHILTIHVNVTAKFVVNFQGQRLTFNIIEITPEADIAATSLDNEVGTEFFFDTMVRVATQQFLVPKLAELGQEGLELPDFQNVTFVDPAVIMDPAVPNLITVATDVHYDGEL